MGKGSKPRPCNKKQYDENFDNINWALYKTCLASQSGELEKAIENLMKDIDD